MKIRTHTNALLLTAFVVLGGVTLTPEVSSVYTAVVPMSDGTGTSNAVIEGFEQQSFPALPDGTPYYVFSNSGTVLISSTQAQTGTQSLKHIATSGGHSVYGIGAGYCGPAGVDFYFYPTGLGGGSASSRWGFSTESTTGASGTDYLYTNWGLGSNLFITSRVNSGTVTNDASTLGNPTANAWNHWGVFCVNGNTFTFVNYDLGTSQSITRSPGWASMPYFHFAVASSQADTYLDQVKLGRVASIPNVATQFTTADATASVTGLDGFDVDPTGVTAIARTDGISSTDDGVATFDAQGLGSPLGVDATHCNRVDGVMAAQFNVVYVDCIVLSGVPVLRLANNGLGTPPTGPPGCANTYDDEFSSGFDEDDTAELSDIGLATVDFEFETNCSASVAIFVGTQDGKVGVLSGTFTPSVSFTDFYTTTYATGQAITLVCGQIGDDALDSDNDSDGFLIAADAGGSATVAWKWNNQFVNPTLTSYRTFANAIGLDCSAVDNFIMCTPTQARVINIGTGQLVSSATIAAESDGCAISQNGEWTAVASSGTVYVYNATSGEVVATATVPSGTFRGVRLDATGQNLWVATTTTIARYEIYTATTGTPVDTEIIGEPTFTATSTGGAGGGIVGVSSNIAVYATIGTVLALSFIGYRFTAGNKKKDDAE